MRTWVGLVITSTSWTEMPSWTKKTVSWNSSCSCWTIKSLRTICAICCSSKSFCGTIGSHITRCFNSCPSSAIVTQRTDGRRWILLCTSCWTEEPSITVSTSSISSSTEFPNSTYDWFLVLLGTGVSCWALCTRFLSTQTVVTIDTCCPCSCSRGTLLSGKTLGAFLGSGQRVIPSSTHHGVTVIDGWTFVTSSTLHTGGSTSFAVETIITLGLCGSSGWWTLIPWWTYSTSGAFSYCIWTGCASYAGRTVCEGTSISSCTWGARWCISYRVCSRQTLGILTTVYIWTLPSCWTCSADCRSGKGILPTGTSSLCTRCG